MHVATDSSVPASAHRRPEPRPDAEAALAALTEQARADMALTGSKPGWLPAPSDPDELRVLVIGGGQAGVGVAFALQRQGIDGVLVVDDHGPETIGCWDRYARMHTLRSPKEMKGLELDVPALHTRRWFEARYGPEAWASIRLVPRLDWQDYLLWYRETTGVDVRFHTRVTAVHRPDEPDGAFGVDVETPEGPQTLRARRVVFALGLDGGGGPRVPEIIRSLPRERWRHTEEEFDPAAFAGRRVAVLGGGASGFDNAGTLLEAGAASATVFLRRDEVPDQNTLRWMEFPGMQEHFFDLTDEQKWEFTLLNGALPQPPTQHTIWRCHAHPGFRLVTGTGWHSARMVTGPDADEIEIVTDAGDTLHVDAVIAATGYDVDLSLRPELAEFVDAIALWRDRFAPAADHPLGALPHLGGGFEFTARDEADAPVLSRLFHFSTGARLSMGVTGNQLSGIFGGLTRMAWRITTDLTRENWPALMDEFRAFRHTEVDEVGPHRDELGWYPQAPRY